MKDAISMTKMGMRVMPVHGLAWQKDAIGCTCGKPDCKSVGKHPIFPQWQKICENDIQTVEGWFRKYPYSNLGVITGEISNLVVLDIDPKNGGSGSFLDMEAKYGDLPETPTVITGSGGKHYYFRHPGVKLTNRTNFIGNGIDFRGDGGFVVAPHSKHASGNNYEWELSFADIPFADMPNWLLREVQNSSGKPRNESIAVMESGVLVAEGGRDSWLTSIAGTMRRRGLSYRPIMAALWYANMDQCDPPLSKEDVQRIAKSISRKPIGDH